MRFPIKINKSLLPLLFHGVLPCQSDPRKLLLQNWNFESFEDCVSAIKIDNTWKSTKKKRHIATDKLIIEALSETNYPDILEVGASCGSTSLELISKLNRNYGRYYVTDIFWDIPFFNSTNITYFYHPKAKTCFMRVSDSCLIYNEMKGAIFPMGIIASRLLNQAPKYDQVNCSSVSMINPDLKQLSLSDFRIVIEEFNILKPWFHEPVDVIKVANVFNKVYFSDEDINRGLFNLKSALNIKGLLIITDNRQEERVSLFSKSKSGKFIFEKKINGGAEITSLVVKI